MGNDGEFIDSMDFCNSKIPFSIKKCLCGGTPVVDYEAKKITCPICDKEFSDIEFSELLCGWNRMNLSETDILKEAIKISEKYLSILKKPYIQPFSAWEEEVFREYREHKTSKSNYGFVYIAHTQKTNNYKIGSTCDISRRLSTLKIGNPHISMIATKPAINRFAEEHMLHKIFASSRINGEWFELTSEQLSDAITQYGFNYCIEEPIE